VDWLTVLYVVSALITIVTAIIGVTRWIDRRWPATKNSTYLPASPEPTRATAKSFFGGIFDLFDWLAEGGILVFVPIPISWYVSAFVNPALVFLVWVLGFISSLLLAVMFWKFTHKK
jgi:hypothetical protein